jgi:hypothetical protein
MTDAQENEVLSDALRTAIYQLEQNLMNVCPSVNGGRLKSETAEDYCTRTRSMQEVIISRLSIARKMLAEAMPQPPKEDAT